MELPSGLDVDFYRQTYADLSTFTVEAACDHYRRHGRQEGRIGAALALRETIFEAASRSASVLEIGPFCNPSVAGKNVAYFDVMDGDGLRERAKAIGYPVVAVPRIEFVSPVGDLDVVNRSFDAVISVHCIEHQPDLVAHLRKVERILATGGAYYMVVPDKRYTFDHAIAPSTVAQVLCAHHEKRRVHTLQSVVEHRALTTHNQSHRHWAGDHFNEGWTETIAPRAEAAIAEFERAKGGYVDVHAWQFTPESFGLIVDTLRRMKMIGLTIANVYDPAYGRNEFTAILTKE